MCALDWLSACAAEIFLPTSYHHYHHYHHLSVLFNAVVIVENFQYEKFYRKLELAGKENKFRLIEHREALQRKIVFTIKVIKVNLSSRVETTTIYSICKLHNTSNTWKFSIQTSEKSVEWQNCLINENYEKLWNIFFPKKKLFPSR